MARIHWTDLPPTVHTAVAEHVGEVHSANTATGGGNSAIATHLHTATGRYFVKGIPNGHPQAATQQREADINPHLPPSCPRLLWRVQTAGWDLLGFEHLTARIADYTPGSPDLGLVTTAIAELAATICPTTPTLKRAEQRWSTYAAPALLPHLVGDTLLHTDLAPHNVLVDDKAHLIDWAWPTRGAAWIDPAVWIIRLIDAGHTPAEAEHQAARLPTWHTAPSRALDDFAAANLAMWQEITHADPTSTWKHSMATSTQHWTAHRAST